LFWDDMSAIAGAVTYAWLVAAMVVQAGWLAFLLGMLPMILFGVLAYYESGWARVFYVFNPRWQYWSFLLGDIGIALALRVAANGDRSRQPWLFHQWWWVILIGPICGVVGALAFHFLLNKPGYLAPGRDGRPINPTAIDTPTFRLHAVMTWPVLFAAVISFLVPYAWTEWSWGSDAAWIMTFSGVWILGMIADEVRRVIGYGPDPKKVHLSTVEVNNYRKSKRKV